MTPEKWEVYIAIARKVESNGSGDDVSRNPSDLAMQQDFIDTFARHLPAPARVLAPGAISEAAMLAERGYETHALVLGRDNVRWLNDARSRLPDPNLLVSDGKKFWFYTPPFDEGEQGQVIEKKTSEVQTKFAHALLSGSFSIARNMKVKQEKPSRFALIPKKGTAGTVIRAEIEVDPGEKLIKKVILSHRDGTRSEISLSAIKLGEPLEDRLFNFVPPPDTDVIKE